MATSRAILSISMGAVLSLGMLTGCNDDKVTYTDPVSESRSPLVRPEPLKLAAEEIRAGKPKVAQQRVEAWLTAHENSPFGAEARYLRGQALFEQGQYLPAKESHDIAIEKAPDRTLKALAILARADCNFKMKKYNKASRQLHWLETVFRDITALRNDEVMYKLGLCHKMVGQTTTADYWFDKVIEMHATGPFAADARRQHSKLGPGKNTVPTFYSLELASFSDERKALQEAEIYREKGYREVSVHQTTILSTTYYSVQVGKYFNKNDAKRALDDAELSGLHASIKPSYVRVPR